MAECVAITKVISVELRLSLEEASVLLQTLDIGVGGDDLGPRRHTKAIAAALREHAEDFKKVDMKISGVIYIDAK